MVKVIASEVRKGNVLEHEDGKLYVVLSADSFRPGKGTPTTTVVMRRIADGVKTEITVKTTEGLEKAFVEDVVHNYLFDDGTFFVFMNPNNYEQVQVPKDVLGEQALFLQENMECYIKLHNDVPLAVDLPAKVTLEITETEPVTKGQTASSSYKPAILTNGVRTMVPPHISAGTRIIVSTIDNSYVERAKD